MIAGRPDRNVALPPALEPVIDGRAAAAVWRNELGGLTFEVGTDPQRCFIKWAPTGSGLDLGAEADRLAWAGPHASVPRVLGQGTHATGSWLMTSALPGDNAASDRWTGNPARAVAAIGAGLRTLHDELPVDECPFSWSVDDRVRLSHQGAAASLVDPDRWHAEHRGLDLEGALARLAAIPPVDRLVVCHGDACVPNTLITADGTCSGHVDLGALGVADRWADLAIATWSTVWNYGPGWEEPLLAAYGVEPDDERTAYYRLLWDLGP